MDKGAQPQHTAASDSLHAHFSFQPLAEPVPGAGVSGHPTRAAVAAQVTFLTRRTIAAGKESAAFFLAEQGSAARLKQMFCGLCSMSHRCKPFPSLRWARARAQAPGCCSPAGQELCRFPGLSLRAGGAGVSPTKQRKDGVWTAKRVPCMEGSRTEASHSAAFGVQIQHGPERSQRAAADRCVGCSPGTAGAPAPELCPVILWAPGLGSWRLQICPTSSWTFLHPSLQPYSLHLPP